MRIALVSPYSWTYPGGVMRHIEALAGQFDRLGHDSDEGIGLGLPLARGLTEAMGGTLDVRSDASVAPPMAAEASPSSLGGRGLVLVAGLATAWGWETRDGGKSVWVEVAAPLE